MTWDTLPPAEAERAVADWVAARGLPAYRLRQILPRLWERPIAAWGEASDLPRSLAAQLEREHPLRRPALAARQQSRDGTVKLLWRFADGAAVESVVIPDRGRRTLCLSSQSGCAFGCVFCATGRMGFGRHLEPWEIAAQVRELVLDGTLGRPSHVVFMGMGEPLHNWEAVDVALSILNDARGFGIAARHITVSTVGLVPGLEALARRREQFGVAWSLHSPFPERRAELMPVERRYPIPVVVGALRAFARRVTFEYVLIAGRNDRAEDALELARLARELGAHVNLLSLHPGGAPDLAATPREQIERFAGALRAAGVNTTIRRSRGLDIAAACGQLRVALERRRRVAAQHHGDVDEQAGVGLGDDAADA
jgi:23S rRNA (adenine2503-C2)-methyltransferase